jgi:thiamine biosynthesis lipoprotein
MENPLAFRAMNTDFLVAGVPAGAAEEVKAMVELAETRFSRFSPKSEINRLNQASTAWTQVSELTYDLLAEAVEAYHATGGLFNPFLADKMRAVGYDRSFETLPPVTDAAGISACESQKECPRVATHPLSEPLEFDFAAQRIKLMTGATIDVGGIAKGWIAQRAANRLIASGIKQGLIDAGGDVVLWGSEPTQGSWGVGIGHPLAGDHDIADLWLTGLTAIATSSIVKRRWQRAGELPAHHILDPHTGRPACSDLLQATVIGRDLTVTEQYTKGLIILGSAAGSRWLAARRPDLAYILVRSDGAILQSDNLNTYTIDWQVDDHVELACDTH